MKTEIKIKIGGVAATMAVLITFSPYLTLSGCSTNEKKNGMIPTKLVLGLDGIPYSTFKKMQDGGHFRNFQPVSPMIATFPSISDPNWTRLFNLPPERAFTKAFYDPDIKTDKGMGSENGSLVAHVARAPLYEKSMDFRLEGVWEHLSMLIWTETTALYWLESLEKRFSEFSGRSTYFALIINTDLISHTQGEKVLMNYLATIEDRIEKIQKHYRDLYGRDLEVILVSDHGNSFIQPKDISWEQELKEKGWDVVPTLAKPKDVAFYVPEILGFGAFYCLDSSRARLAKDLALISQVQSTMIQDSPTDIHIYRGAGDEALISYDSNNDLLRYKILKGKDPYDQLKYFKHGALSAHDYFEKSAGDPMPYALIRIWEAFNKNSQIKPRVLANGSFGYVFGNKALRLLTDIRGFASTHGALYRDDSLGIFTSTKESFPAIRPDDFKNFVDVSSLEK